MKIAQGTTFKNALNAIRPSLTSEEKAEATANAMSIVGAVVDAYDTNIDSGHVGINGKGIPDNFKKTIKSTAGLVYGRIQSGKTRAMITSTALAIDNGFKIVIVLTSDNVRLVAQTKKDFDLGLPGVSVYSKLDLVNDPTHILKVIGRNKNVVIVCSKGQKSLSDVINFFDKINTKKCPTVIFDDEGDQATLDTNTAKRTQQSNPIEPSTINKLIHYDKADSLRKKLPFNIFVSVTGTPNSIVLQSLDSTSKVSFIKLLEPGKEYTGGETFFPSPDPTDNKYISLIDTNERIDLLNGNGIPTGLQQAICFFVLAAATASTKISWPEDGYKFLCHPSVRNNEQGSVRDLIDTYLEEVIDALHSPKKTSSAPILASLQQEHKKLQAMTNDAPSFADLSKIILDTIDARKILLINAKTTNDDLTYSPYFNFLVGGNTLGRGLAIKNLLVTYYVREPKTAQMDTMYQHARMFGYRKKTLPYTQVFLPPQLYNRFHQVYISDEELRSFIKEYGDDTKALLVRLSAGSGLRPTRKNVLPATHIKTLVPGTQLYPDFPTYKAPEATSIQTKVFQKMKSISPRYEDKKEKQITTKEAISLVSLIKTNATNKWNDKQIPDFLNTIAGQLEDGVLLKYRTSEDRKAGPNGLLGQGVLSGKDVKDSAAQNKPVLWITKVTGSKDRGWDGVDFAYPTIVFPKAMTLFVFNNT